MMFSIKIIEFIRKNNFTIISKFTLLLFIFIIQSSCLSINHDYEPERPKNLPNDAFWAGGPDGGMYFLLKQKKDTEYEIKIYSDYDGYIFEDSTVELKPIIDLIQPSTDVKKYFYGFDVWDYLIRSLEFKINGIKYNINFTSKNLLNKIYFEEDDKSVEDYSGTDFLKKEPYNPIWKNTKYGEFFYSFKRIKTDIYQISIFNATNGKLLLRGNVDFKYKYHGKEYFPKGYAIDKLQNEIFYHNIVKGNKYYIVLKLKESNVCFVYYFNNEL